MSNEDGMKYEDDERDEAGMTDETGRNDEPVRGDGAFAGGKGGIVVIGAGLTGLTAAHALREAGRDVTVLERTGKVGGLARSLEVDGAVFDVGPHYFFLKFDPRSDLLVKECLGDRADVFDFQVSAVIRGRNLAWPPNLSALRHLPLSSTLKTIKNTLRRRFPPHRDCEGFMTAFYGKAIFDEFTGPYIDKKVPTLGPSGLSREWWLQIARTIDNTYKGAGQDEMKKIEQRRKVSIFTRFRVLLKLVSGLIKTARGKHLRKVLYPHGGMGALSKALAKRFEEQGGVLRLNATGVRLEKEGDRIAAVTWEGGRIEDPRPRDLDRFGARARRAARPYRTRPALHQDRARFRDREAPA